MTNYQSVVYKCLNTIGWYIVNIFVQKVVKATAKYCQFIFIGESAPLVANM